MSRCHFQRPRNAVAAVEFAVVLIILMPMLIGVWEIGRLVNVQQLIANAAREGGRQASTGEKNTAQVREIIVTYLRNAGLNKINSSASNDTELRTGGRVLVQIKVYDAYNQLRDGIDPTQADQNDRIEVKVEVLFNDVEYSPTNYFLDTNTTISATVNWHCMRDIPLVINSQIPLS